MNRRKKLDYTPSRDATRQRSRITRSSLHGGLPKNSDDSQGKIETPSVPASTTATDDLKSILREDNRKSDNDDERSRRSLVPLMSLRTNYEDATEPDTTRRTVVYQGEDDPLGPLLDFGGSGNSRSYSSGELPLVEECDYYFMADIRSGLKDGRETFKKGSQDTVRSKTGSSHSSEVINSLPGFGSRWTDSDDRDTSKYLMKGSTARDSRDISPHRQDYGRHTDRSPDSSDLRNVIEEQRTSESTTGLSRRSDDTCYDKGRRKRDYHDDSRARDKSRSKYSRRDDKKASSTSRILSVAAQELMDEKEKEGYKRDLNFRKDKGKGQLRYQKYDATSVSPADKVSGYSRSCDIEKKSDIRDQRYKNLDHSSLSVEDKLDHHRGFDFQDMADERDKLHGHYDLSPPPDKMRTSDSPERPSYEDKMKGYFWSESRVADTNYASLYHNKGDLGEGNFLSADQEKQRIDDGYVRDLMSLPEGKGRSLLHDVDKSRAYSDAGESSYRASLPFDMSSSKKEARMEKGKFLSGFELGTPFFGGLDSADKDKDNAFDCKYPERKAGKTESLHSDGDYDYVYRKEDKLTKSLLPPKKWLKRECIRDDNYPTLYSDKEECTAKENSNLHLVSTDGSRDKSGTGIENIAKVKDLAKDASAFGIRGRGMGRGRGTGRGRGRGRGRGGILFRGRGRGGTAPIRGRGGTFPVRGKGQPFRGRGRGIRGKPRGAFYAGRGRAQDSRPPIRVFGKFRNTFKEDRSGYDRDKYEELKNLEVKHRESKTSHGSNSHRSERSTSKDQGKDKRGPARSSSRERREQSQKAHSQEDKRSKEAVKTHETSSKLGKADVATKSLDNKTKQSDDGMGQIREGSANKNKSLGSEISSSSKAHPKGKVQRRGSSSSNSSSSSSCSCSVSGSSSDSGSSTSSKRRSTSSGKTTGRKENNDQNSSQSKRIVIKLSNKDKRSVIMKDREETELTNEKGDDDKELKKTAQGKSNKKQNSPADGASKGNTKNVSSVTDSKLKSAFSSQVTETRQGLAQSGVAIPPGNDVQKRKTGVAARRLCAMSLREQNKLVESFWSTREQHEPEKPPKDTPVPAEKSVSNKSEINCLYNEIFSKDASSSVHTHLQPTTNDKGKETKEQLCSSLKPATSDHKNTTRKEKSMADHKRTVEQRPEVKRPKIHKPSGLDNRTDVTVELREADLSQHKIIPIAESLDSHSKGFGIQTERGDSYSEYSSNKGLNTNQHVSSHVQGNLISIIPDPNAFKQPTQQSKTQGTPGLSSDWLPLECDKKDLTDQPSPALMSEAQSYPLYSEQGALEGEGLVENVPAEQFYETEYYEEEPVAGQEWTKGTEEVAKQNEEYYYEDADYQGEGAEGVDQYTEGEWADGQCVDSFTEDEQQAQHETEGPVQGVEDNPENDWGYEETYQEPEHATGEQEAQFGEEEWIDPATGYAYEYPQAYAATEGHGQEEGYYEEYQWQQQEETGVTPVEVGQEYYGDGTAEWGGYGEQYEGEQYEGEWYQGEQYQGEQYQGEQYQGEQSEGKQPEGNQYEGNQYEGNQMDVYVDEVVGEDVVNKEEDENLDTVGIQDSATEDLEKVLSRKDDELSKGQAKFGALDPDDESALGTDATSPEEYPKEESPAHMNSPDAEPSKPLKSILKKSKPRTVPVSTGAGAATTSSSQTASVLAEEPNDAIGQECIVKLSGERAAFYCNLCQCHFNTLTAKNLHLKGMKHIEMYLRSKSNLLNSVIAQTEKAPGKRESPVDPFFLPPKFPRYR